MQDCNHIERLNTINVTLTSTVTFSPTLDIYAKADEITDIFSNETFKTGAFFWT